MPLSQHANDPEFAHRFRREAQAAASLSHPGVVAVYDTGSENGTHFIVMEYVDGRTLKDAIRAEAPLYPDRAAEITADVCSALAAAHARGLVHRDVKPANIMLMPDGRVKLMDLGIARAAAGETLTQTAAMLGTAQYLSPEQAQGQAVDFRSDLYSLGCCLYEMLTGTVPFRGATPVAIAYRHVREDPAPPRLLNPDIPQSLEAVCLKAMAKRPEDRYQTAAELRADLERARAGQRVAAGPAAAGAATAAMATTMLPPLAGYPGPGDPTAAPGGPVTAGRAARHAEPPPGRPRWWLYVLVPLGVLALAFGVAFLVSRLVDPPPETQRGPDPAHRHRAAAGPHDPAADLDLPAPDHLPAADDHGPADHRPDHHPGPAGPGPDARRDRAPAAGGPGPARGAGAPGEPAAGPGPATPSRPTGSSSRSRRPGPPWAAARRWRSSSASASATATAATAEPAVTIGDPAPSKARRPPAGPGRPGSCCSGPPGTRAG